jgi:hypothetical protein
MIGQAGDGERAEAPAHAEDRINWARRRTHARQRAADSRQRRIAYSLDPLPAAGPAPAASNAPYSGAGDLSASGVLPALTISPAADPGRDSPAAPSAASPIPTLDAEC